MTSRLRFDQFAEMIAERIEDPSSSGLERYVGLEHLDPEAIDIKRWGAPADVTSTKFRFYPGDVIYGRRRAYQRKAGLADFDGLASAHALVLRAVVGVCDPAYLAYMLVSESFTRVAVEISVGSLSPTINWRDLRVQEFDLPSLDEQRRAVEVMRAVDREIEAAEHIVTTASQAKFQLAAGIENRQLPMSNLSDLVITLTRGAAPSYSDDGEVVVINQKCIRDGQVQVSTPPARRSSRLPSTERLLVRNDILVNSTGTGTAGRVGLVEVDQSVLTIDSHVTVVRVSPEKVDPGFVMLWLHANQHEVERLATGSTGQTEISRLALGNISIPIPERPDQTRLAFAYMALRAVQASAQESLSRSHLLRSSLLQELIG